MGEDLITLLMGHCTLGGRCTCGATLPEGRLDTNRWFAEHVADAVAELLDYRSFVEGGC